MLEDESVAAVQLRIPYETSIWVNVASKADKGKFAIAVKDMFPDSFVLNKAVFTTFAQKKNEEESKEYTFAPEANVDLRKFWESPEFREMYETIHKTRLNSVKLKIAGWVHESLDPVADEGHLSTTGLFMFSPVLKPGRNPFQVRALGADGAVMQSSDITLFYVNDYVEDLPEEDEGRTPFHADTFEEHCSACHDTEIPESARSGGESVEDQCASCHTSLQTQASSHFPVEAWDCLSCHDADATPAYALRAEKDFGTEACFECHSSIEEATTSSAVIHFPATDRCLSCHDAHASPAPSLLVDDIYMICASCHQEAAETPHPIVNHPVRTVRKPSKEAVELSCASCHDPHASEQPKLLSTSRKNLCKNCHDF